VDVFRIEGGNRLSGTVKISGAKNSALPLFAASLLSPEETILHNVPNLSDVQFMAEILEHLGAKVENFDTNSWRITPQEINPDPPYELVRKMRASICLLGPLVGRLKKANMPMPGGCVIGNRPIDLHLKALSDLGADERIISFYWGTAWKYGYRNCQRNHGIRAHSGYYPIGRMCL
jgi:UDP-N-acetylglucosamine 1-carboxyvinyltransferase